MKRKTLTLTAIGASALILAGAITVPALAASTPSNATAPPAMNQAAVSRTAVVAAAVTGTKTITSCIASKPVDPYANIVLTEDVEDCRSRAGWKDSYSDGYLSQTFSNNTTAPIDPYNFGRPISPATYCVEVTYFGNEELPRYPVICNGVLYTTY